MVSYTTAPGDVEMGVEPRTVVLVEKKSSTGWTWKVLGALFITVLCLGGVLLFAWYWDGRQESMVRRSSVSLTVFRNNKPAFSAKNKNLYV